MNRYRVQPRSTFVRPKVDALIPGWHRWAACRDEDPELFFPVGIGGVAIQQTAEAKEVCRRCPEMETCLQWALETGQEAGIWGGLSEDERKALKRRARRARERATA